MFRSFVLILVCAPLAFGGCELEDPAIPLPDAVMNRVETYLNASIHLSMLCSEAPLNGQQQAEADGNANVMLRAARPMIDEVLTEGSGTVREELHRDAALYDSCMPYVAKKIRTALNAFPPPPQIYDAPGRP